MGSAQLGRYTDVLIWFLSAVDGGVVYVIVVGFVLFFVMFIEAKPRAEYKIFNYR